MTPAQLFYDFRFDDHVLADHLLRPIDGFLDLKRVRTALKPFYSTLGRPSVDLELMIRMLTGRARRCVSRSWRTRA